MRPPGHGGESQTLERAAISPERRRRPERAIPRVPLVLASLGLLAWGTALAAGEPPTPRRVLLVESLSRDLSPFNDVATSFRRELAARSRVPVEFYELTLQGLGLGLADEGPAIEYVRVFSSARKPDLVVLNGGPAARFWARNRAALPSDAPVLFGAVEERHLAALSLTPDDVVVANRIDLGGLLSCILRLLPDTESVVVVAGESALERFWVEQVRREWAPLAGRVRITEFAGLPFEETLRRLGSLPRRSAVFFVMMLRDGAGVPFDMETAIERLRDAANAPVFSWSTTGFGRGQVGGPLAPLSTLGREVAVAAEKVLSGTPPSALPAQVVAAEVSVFDERELRRWGIPESRLPRGSEVRFREPALLVEYRLEIAIGLAVIAGQALAIGGLLVARRRRRRAEEEARRLRSELAHAGRVSVLGQLASSLAHELNQPLGAILRNAEAAELFLKADPPDLQEVRSIVADIQRDDQRASAVIDRMRALLKRREPDVAPASLPRAVDAVVALALPDARTRRVKLDVDVPRDLPPVSGDQVEVQQVLLNLIVNALEALGEAPEAARTLTVRASASAAVVELTVTDSGPGLVEAELGRVFEPFYSTKPSGLGMGLAISRSLVERQGGRIEAESPPGGGTTFRVLMPVAGLAA